MKPVPTATLAQLVNQFREKFEGPNVARTCVLIGAGCSYNSKIPLGGGIVTLLQRETFRQLHVTDDTKWPLEDAEKHGQEFDEYLNAKNLRSVFEAFCEAEENLLQQQFDALSEEIKKSKLPPDWQRSENWNKLFHEKLDNFYSDARYEYWFRRYSENASDRQRFVERVIDGKDTGYGYVTLASLIAEGYVRNVFTTNFDDLLHDALMLFFNERAKVYAHSDLSDLLNLRDKKANIVKLHGDFRYQDIRNTTFEIDETRNRLTEKLRDALAETPCFNLVTIGYGGADVSIINQLHEAKKRNPQSAFKLFWTERNPYNKLHWRVQHLLENTPNNFFLQIESFDLFMLQIHQALQLKPVEIVEKAKERQKQIDFYYQQAQVEIKESNLRPDEKASLQAYLEAAEIFNEAHENKDPEQQCRLYEKVLQIKPDYHEALNNWGTALAKLKRYDEAIEKYEQAIRIRPNDHRVLNNWGGVLYSLRRYKEAIDKYQQAVHIRPDFHRALNNWGIALTELHLFDEAALIFEQTVRIKRDDFNALNNWGTALAKLKRYDEAIEKYEQAIRIRPDYHRALSNWGIALFDLKLYKDATKKFIQVLDLNPDDYSTIFNIACCYSLQSEPQKAIYYLELWKNSYPQATLKRIHEDADLDNIKHDAHFQEFIKRWYEG